MTMSRRADDAVGNARRSAEFVVRSSLQDPLQIAQLQATLAVLEVLVECENHLFKLTTGRSA